jgi:propionyl-CoA carboxylase alpha chain/3-methylcrotonyl-CoA carboxylase alpha subunit/acetyl-CoA/propionyl-CoA carboxylase biotin carboxyl carrier protein
MSGILPFRSVLIANRGEIAVRILRSVQAMGLRALVLHHPADHAAPATRQADEVIEITGDTPVAAFLDAPQIITRAREAAADAIHPGYGFLSENAAFARAVTDSGMIFIGPSAESMALMGDKVRARAFVAAHGFPVAPSAIEEDDPASFVARACAVGVPLLIKPAAGGGGKGMHIVRNMDQLEDGLAQAQREGIRYFGDGRLYVERYVERPRHIEVQVLADHYGNVVHLSERECTLQRRFQKVVEESPSPALTARERQKICDVAVGIARAACYRNAGTVEFIYGEGAFFFLEMNTRLQVEHPVTEAVTGIDLVAEQLRIAGGEPLGFSQQAVNVRGHAVEVRIYAEDADAGFAPCTGQVLRWLPPSGAGIRVDAGIEQGSEVSASFDPMLAKLVTHAQDRQTALNLAVDALGKTVLLGCRSNIGFLRRLLQLPAVRNGDMHTDLISESMDALRRPAPPAAAVRALVGAAALKSRGVCDAADAVPRLHAAMGAWRN